MPVVFLHPPRPRARPATPPRPPRRWPWYARVLRWFARKKDRGLGDTVARLIPLKPKRCRCQNRRARLNRKWPLRPI